MPDERDAVKLAFVAGAPNRSRVARSAIVCRTRNGFPLTIGMRVMSLGELA